MKPTEPQNIPSAKPDSLAPSIEEVEQAILLLQSNQDFFIAYQIDEAAADAIEILQASRSEWAVMPLLELLVKYPVGGVIYSHRMSTRIKRALMDIGELAVLPLMEALRTGDQRIRRHAVELLGMFQDARAQALLSHALKDSDPSVRYWAVFAVSGFPPENGLPLLIDALHDENPQVRRLAVNKLSHERYGEERTTTALMEMVEDPDPEVRRNAVEALYFHRDARAIPLLLEAMQDQDAWTREAAIRASSVRKEPRFIPQYLRALQNTEQRVHTEQLVRNQAGKALVAFGNREALVLALLQSDELSASDKLDAMEVLGRTRAYVDLSHDGAYPNQILDYRFSSVEEYIQKLQKDGLTPEFEQALQVVLGEIKARQDRRQLLRGTRSDLPDASEELLRSHSGVDSSSQEDLLRASDPPPTKSTDRPSWLKRLLGRK